MIVASLIVPTVGLILAVACVGLLAVAWRERARHQRTVNNWMDNAAFLRDEREEARAAASDRLDRLLKEERKVRDLPCQLDTTTHHNRDLQAKIAELESERRAYDLTVANCDHLRVENERLASQLEAVGIKPAEVLAAEHDRIGCADSVSRLSEMSEPQKQAMLTFINSQLGIKQLNKPPRVRDDETND